MQNTLVFYGRTTFFLPARRCAANLSKLFFIDYLCHSLCPLLFCLIHSSTFVVLFCLYSAELAHLRSSLYSIISKSMNLFFLRNFFAIINTFFSFGILCFLLFDCSLKFFFLAFLKVRSLGLFSFVQLFSPRHLIRSQSFNSTDPCVSDCPV